MNDLLQTLIAVLQYSWPFRAVESWERGVYFVFGYRWRVVGPGRWPIVPFFMDVRPVSIVPAVLGTPLLTITLRDGRTLTFSAAATVCVTDAWKAFEVDDYDETTRELVGARLAEKLAEVDAARVDPDNRRRLMGDLIRWLNDETKEYGVAVRALRFTNFSVNLRTYRILTDTAVAADAW